MPRDGDVESGRLKGFGYVDFEDRQSLIDALDMNDNMMQNRKIKVDLATNSQRDNAGGRDGGRFGDRRGGDRYTLVIAADSIFLSRAFPALHKFYFWLIDRKSIFGLVLLIMR